MIRPSANLRKMSLLELRVRLDQVLCVLPGSCTVRGSGRASAASACAVSTSTGRFTRAVSNPTRRADEQTQFNLLSAGGLAVVAVGHPFDTVKIRLQTQPSVNPIYSEC